MKMVIFRKKYLLMAALFIFSAPLIFLFFFTGSSHRELASFSQAEIESAEKYLLNEEDDKLPQGLFVAPVYKDFLEEQAEYVEDVDAEIEKRLINNYNQSLLKAVEKKTGKTPKKTNLQEQLDAQGELFLDVVNQHQRDKFIETFLDNARKDGYKIILDSNYDIISAEPIAK